MYHAWFKKRMVADSTTIHYIDVIIVIAGSQFPGKLYSFHKVSFAAGRTSFFGDPFLLW